MLRHPEMPIVTDSNNSQMSLNGDAGYSVLNSLDDEESFVVLERSTANDIVRVPSLEMSSPSTNTSQTLLNSCSFPVFNNMPGSAMTSSRTSQHSQAIPIEPLAFPIDSTNMSVSGEEIDKRLQEVLHENINLKENLYQTNLAMKQQLSTVRLLQDRALEVQKNHQAKFEETKALILKLGSEKNELQDANLLLNGEMTKIKEENKALTEANAAIEIELGKLKAETKELKGANMGFGTEAAKLLSENAQLLADNAALKKQLSTAQETLQTLAQSDKKASMQPTAKEVELHELVDQLSKKLETVERARRQQEFDIDRLTAQIGRANMELNEAQRKLAHSENALQLAQSQNQARNENSLPYLEKVTRYDGLLKQLKASIQEEQTKFSSLSSWLSMTDPANGNLAQFEISELRRLLAEEQTQSVARKENLYLAVSTIHELLVDFQKLGQDLERVRADHAVKESHGLAYDEMQKKGFTEKLDSLTAKLVQKEEALTISERHLASLQEAIRLQNADKKEAINDPWWFMGELFKKTIFMETFQQPTLSIDDGKLKVLEDQVQSLKKELAIKEDKLQANIKEIELLKTAVQNLKSTSETVPVLEEQAKIYQADFEAERKCRESLVGEKQRMLEDLQHLQRRNQELMDELTRTRSLTGEYVAQTTETTNRRQQEHSPSPPPPRPQDDVIPPPKRFVCPNPECNMTFNTVEPLQLHVIACLKLDD